jgi:hypothetical protein
MADKKISRKEIKALQAEIEEYEKKPVRTNERRLKLNMSFDEAVGKIVKAVKPPKKPKDK